MKTTAGENKVNRDFVKSRFQFEENFRIHLERAIPNFGYNGFGEILFYRTYSRQKENGKMETWGECVRRVIEGVMSIRMSYYQQNRIPWDKWYWADFAEKMALSMFKMEWLPPGRGLWAMGTDFMYERGSMALYNCAFVHLSNKTLADDLYWMMDCLMNGVGVGFGVDRVISQPLSVKIPNEYETIQITDTREGWCDSVQMQIQSFIDKKQHGFEFDYSAIRPKGTPIKGFGGTCSGPDSLKSLHTQIAGFFSRFVNEVGYDEVMLKTDLANVIGCCVVAGNVRRSAEIGICDVNDPVFKDLKNYEKYPYRKDHGWMSNNSVTLHDHEDFERMDEIAERVRTNGEPGYLNMRNIPYGRLRTAKHDDVPIDHATGINPCGEIPLESHEVCNLAETFPTVCRDVGMWFQACEFATFYTSTVTLLPTHSEETNRVVMRNRRIGVGIVDFTGWKQKHGLNKCIRWMRDAYKIIRITNKQLADECGIKASIRVTTVKPGGTIPKLPGRTSGAMHPNFEYMIRRFTVAENTPLCERLIDAQIPYEDSAYSAGAKVFEMPLYCGAARPVSKVSIWEQAANLVTLQENWSDNAVSNTLMFREDESDQLESLLSHLAPKTKSVSLLKINAGAYAQMPEEEITKEEYEHRLRKMRTVDFSGLTGESVGELYCEGDQCQI